MESNKQTWKYFKHGTCLIKVTDITMKEWLSNEKHTKDWILCYSFVCPGEDVWNLLEQYGMIDIGYDNGEKI